MRKLAVHAAAILVVLGLNGCSSRKELTSSSAKRLLEESVQRDHTTDFLLPVNLNNNLLKERTLADYKTATETQNASEVVIRRLIDDGFIDQRSETITYPDISGTYKVEIQTKPWGLSVNHITYQLDLMTQPNSPVVSVHYSYQAWYSTGQKGMDFYGNTTGTLQQDNTFTVKYPYGTLVSPSVFRIRSDGSTTQLEGPDGGYGPEKQVTLVGHAKGGSISAVWYSYSPSTKLTKELRTLNGSTVVAGGRYVLGDVKQLLLETETSANGSFAWQLDPTKLGLLLDPTLGQRTGMGRMFFRKQPDGTWVLVNYNF